MFSKISLELTKQNLLLMCCCYDIKKICQLIAKISPYYKNKNIYFRDYQWKSKQKSCLLIELHNLSERLEEHQNRIYGDVKWKYSHFKHFLSYLIKYIERDIIYINSINYLLLQNIKNNYHFTNEIQQKIKIYIS